MAAIGINLTSLVADVERCRDVAVSVVVELDTTNLATQPALFYKIEDTTNLATQPAL
jgi:hypothetical protein